MSRRLDPVGFLMHASWRADVMLAHTFELQGGRHAPGAVRSRFGRLLAEHLDGDDFLDVIVLVSELITNAVRHGRADDHGTIVVHVALAPHVLRVEVCDAGPGFVPPTVPRPRPEGGGNGLVLLAQMSSSWGVACDDGTCVWFERAVSPPPARA
jgi:serine/threonine-protein kinase RsbW